MKKLGTVIRYECITSFKYIWIFYAIEYAVVAAVFVLSYITNGSSGKIGTNGLEFNSFIYVGILGILGFKEDFKMLIQNGFTRKYIFLSTFSLFAFISGIMSLVDTILGNALHHWFHGYHSLFGGLYGYGHSYFLGWVWLFLVYMLICCLFYLVILIINKIGKKISVYAGITLGLTIILIIPALIKFVLPKDFTDRIILFVLKAFGYMTDGTINFMYPVLIFVLAACILSLCSYCVIRRTELKA